MDVIHMNTKEISRSNICCVADSYYQLLNLLSIIYHQIDADGNNIDLYVNSNLLENNNLVFEKIKCFWGIKNTYRVFLKDDHSIKQIYMRFCTPNKYVLERTDNKEFQYEMYDRIYLANPTHFALSIILCNKSADVIYYEDGLGSYYLDLIKYEYPLYQRLLYSIVGNDLRRTYPSKIYLNSIDMYNGRMTNNVYCNLMLGDNDEEYIKLIHSVFTIDTDKYKDKKVVYITQPLYTIKSYKSENKKILDNIENVLFSRKDLLVRVHPMDKTEYNLPEKIIDRACGNWELVSEKTIGNKSVMIGFYSTAQFIPKLLYQREPFVVFFYRLFPGLVDINELVQMEKTIGFLKSQYNNKEKILVPESLSEMISMLEGLKDD